MRILQHIVRLFTGVVVFLVLSGCASVLKNQSTVCVTAKVFSEEENKKLGKDFEVGQELIRKFLKRTEKIQIGITTYKDLSTLGLSPEAVNVNHFPGQSAAANQRRLGSENVQLQFSNPEQEKEFTRELSKWHVLEYPLYNIIETGDRFYFSKKNKEKRGTDMEFIIILRDTSNSIEYIDPQKEPEKYIVKYALKKGELQLERIEAELAAAGGILDIMNKTREQLQLVLFYYFLQDAFRK